MYSVRYDDANKVESKDGRLYVGWLCGDAKPNQQYPALICCATLANCIDYLMRNIHPDGRVFIVDEETGERAYDSAWADFHYHWLKRELKKV